MKGFRTVPSPLRKPPNCIVASYCIFHTVADELLQILIITYFLWIDDFIIIGNFKFTNKFFYL